MITKIVDLSHRQLEAYKYLTIDETVNEVVYGGAAGGGKSFLGCFWLIMMAMKYDGTRWLMGRAKLKTLKQTTLNTWFEVADMLEMVSDVHYRYNSISGEIHLGKGSTIILKDLFFYPKDPFFTSLGSLEISGGFIDECTEITKKARDIVKSRIRYKLHEYGLVPKLFMSCNPEKNWVYDVIYKPHTKGELQDDIKFVSARVTDNPDPNFVKIYTKQLKQLPPLDQQRLLEGDWEINYNEHPFFIYYDKKKHVHKELAYWEDEPIYLSFDFNFDNCVCVVGQKKRFVGLSILRNHGVKGGIRELCKSIKDLYMDHPKGLYIMGDNSGKSSNAVAGLDPKTGQAYNAFSIIREELEVPKNRFQGINKANLAHTLSRDLCNEVFYKLPLNIQESESKELISDIERAMPTEDNKLYKNREKGHQMDYCDAFRYMISGWFPHQIEDVNKFYREVEANK